MTRYRTYYRLNSRTSGLESRVHKHAVYLLCNDVNCKYLPELENAPARKVDRKKAGAVLKISKWGTPHNRLIIPYSRLGQTGTPTDWRLPPLFVLYAFYIFLTALTTKNSPNFQTHHDSPS